MKTSSTARRLIPGLLVALLLAAAGGCGGYPRVSPAACQLGQDMIRICNARRAEQLVLAERRIAEEHEAGAISDRERQYLDDLVRLAGRGAWERAERNARRLVADQSDW